MKTKEELNVLKSKVETLSKKLAELDEDELKEVTGGDDQSNGMPHKYEVGRQFDTTRDYSHFTFTIQDIRVINGVLIYRGPLEQVSNMYKFTNVENSRKFTEQELEAFFDIR